MTDVGRSIEDCFRETNWVCRSAHPNYPIPGKLQIRDWIMRACVVGAHAHTCRCACCVLFVLKTVRTVESQLSTFTMLFISEVSQVCSKTASMVVSDCVCCVTLIIDFWGGANYSLEFGCFFRFLKHFLSLFLYGVRRG